MVGSDRTFAVLADAHGNVWALRAVLADIARRGIRDIVNLGDSVYGVLAPGAAADLLMAPGIRSLRGNQDRIVVEPPPGIESSADHRHVLGELTARHLAWFRSQPTLIDDGDVLFCHGTPASDETYLLEEVTAHGARLASDEIIRRRLGATPQRLIACAHSHVPRLVRLSDGRTVFNPGSVGIPAYTADLPYPHVMESGSPHARYAVVTKRGDEWEIELVALPYEWHIPADLARRNGRPDRAGWIETGRAL